MCGFLGLYSLKSQSMHERFKDSLEIMNNRGPDNTSVSSYGLKGGHLTIGHKRLSILNVDTSGNQPMTSLDGRFTILFNGEIYNYVELTIELKNLGYIFNSASDTEALLYGWVEWRDKVLFKIKGMYSFVIIDNLSGEFYFYRDAFGIKPFYYFITKTNLIFSSDVHSINALLKSTILDCNTVSDYLLFGNFDTGSSTFFKDINILRAGSYLKIKTSKNSEISLQNTEQTKWWLPSTVQTFDGSLNDAAEQLRHLFLQNIELHLRSDVPVGAALSGGIDSSSIVCAIRKLYPDMELNTFTYSAKGALDETSWASIVSNYAKTINHEVSFNQSDIINDLSCLIRAQGEPFGSPSTYAGFILYKKIKDCGIIVSLDGQGADELFAGYDFYFRHYLKSYLDKFDFKTVYRVFRTLKLNKLVTSKDLIKSTLPTFMLNYLSNRNTELFYSQYFTDPINNNKNFKLSDINNRISFSLDTKGRRLIEILRYSTQNGPLQSILRTMDKSSMWSSCENRVPFLTQEIAEFAFSLPENYLVDKDGTNKKVLRQAMKGIIPDEIYNRKDKIGFTPEFQNWIYDKNIGIKYIENLKNIIPLNLANVFNSFKDRNEKNLSRSEYLFHWRLVNFAVWYNEYF